MVLLVLFVSTASADNRHQQQKQRERSVTRLHLCLNPIVRFQEIMVLELFMTS
jgi:hypothetical protein